MREKLLLVLLGGLALVSVACTPASDGGSADAGAKGEKDATTAAATPSPTANSGDEVSPLEPDERLLGQPRLLKGRANIVKVNNRADGKIKVRTNLQLNRIEGDRVTPENVAEVYSSCNGCQSFAVAVQVNVYERGASFIMPRNAAIAENDNCTSCVSIARAYQYVIPVDDVDSLPKEVDRLVRAINKEAHYFERINSMDEVNPQEIQTRLNGILAQFAELDAYLTAATAEETEPSGEARSAEETPTATPSVTPSATVTAAEATPSPSAETSTTAAPATATPVVTEAVEPSPTSGP